MEALLTFTSRRRGRASWFIAVLVLPLFLSLGTRPASAEYPSGYGFQWGPSRPFSSMREPLNRSSIVSAIKMFVDEDEISSRLFGQSGLIIFTDNPQRPHEISYGWKGYMPEKSRIVLDDEGVTSLSLTIAPDPAVREAPDIAGAIAQELRDNLGAEVRVVDGEADFFVSRAFGPSTPAKPGDLSFDIACSPDTFRPDEWTVVDCVSQIHNNSDVTLYSDTMIDSSSGVTPSYSYVFAERNGVHEPVSSQGLRFPTIEVAAGETSVTDLLILMKMSEGTFDSHLNVRVNEEAVASAALRLTASPRAADPPVDLEVKRTLVAKSFELEYGPYEEMPRDGFATYETTVTNRSDHAVGELRVRDRFGRVASIEAEPATAENDLASGRAEWDLSSFGKESLEPGESLILKTTYWPEAEESCGQIETAAIVEAGVDGEIQRYAVPDEWQTVGHCLYGGGGGGAGGVAFGSGGEGPNGQAFDLLWAATVLLSGGGAALVATAMLLRRARR